MSQGLLKSANLKILPLSIVLSIKCYQNFDRDYIESKYGFGQYGHLKNINSSNLSAWNIFPVICVFNFLFKSLFLKINLFILFLLCWVFVAAHGLFSVCGEQGLLFVVVIRLLIVVASLVGSMGSRCVGFSSCGTWAQQLWLTGCRAQAQQLWCTGFVALQHVGSSQIRARTHVPCIGRRILNHYTTREAPSSKSYGFHCKDVSIPCLYLFLIIF